MTQARYDAVADFYASGFDSTDDPATRALLDLLGPVAGLRVVDVACGHGRITRELAWRGAQAVGIDISGQLIRKARENENEPLGLRYLHADIAAPGVLGDDRFDVATCNFGLSDIDDLDAAITAVSAALHPRGRFVFSILHPCFAGGKDISGSWSADGSYYGEGHWTAGDLKSTLRRQVGANHRMLSTYLGALRRHGLWLDQSPNRCRSRTGIRPTMPTASPCSSWPGWSSSRTGRSGRRAGGPGHAPGPPAD